ncbi:hypothetical protein FisN_24Hh230 [Fistulifera solaris]|uniref:OsmC-like protein n=1 Tax=Fistulifera solaris TaxID=1519565 RepID=A0A1Z5K2W1_FISSO|nr:hypothetical protein FisN_24Hh230 [Fistulifera solaris]|eukprot:GAX20519.1 hypothetical protein FisN_24Hh230 [Fistulifera solaris]
MALPTASSLRGASPLFVRRSHRMSGTAGSQDYSEATAKYYKFNGCSDDENKSSVTVNFNTGHVLTTDLPLRMGGKDQASQPVECLLAAWAGCTQATALFVSRQMMRENKSCPLLERLEFVNITATRDERGALALPIHEDPPVPSRLHTLTGNVVVWPSFDEESLQLLQEQTELRCPVANMLIASGCRMNVKWINGDEKENRRSLS